MFNWAYSVLFRHFRDCEAQECRLRSFGKVRHQLVALCHLQKRADQAWSLSHHLHDRHFQDRRGNGLVESFWIAWISLTELNRLTVKMEVSVWWRLRRLSTFSIHGIKRMEWDVVSSMDGWTVNGTVWTTMGNTSYSVPHPHLKAGTQCK